MPPKKRKAKAALEDDVRASRPPPNAPKRVNAREVNQTAAASRPIRSTAAPSVSPISVDTGRKRMSSPLAEKAAIIISKKKVTKAASTKALKAPNPVGRPPKAYPVIGVDVNDTKKPTKATKAIGRPSSKGKGAAKVSSIKEPPAPVTPEVGSKDSSFSVEVAEKDIEGDSLNIEGQEEKEDSDEGTSYWLMKAEPESRMEKGGLYDVKFSINDLAAAKEPEGWDARNYMRLMRKGDLAFFYHSNCHVPGIAGIMEIVREHSIDESAHDPQSPYYDPKSNPEHPKWDLVHVEFRRKFGELIGLHNLKEHAKSGGPLQSMQTIKQSRLSVSMVTKKEWDFILSLTAEKH
ncbi:MAG: hypothetical protein M1827_001989 [Pycnora praestabilis]|nr:MAG: hypothetical protein M1827_001989 [Pycnora praestabilis]